MNVLDGHKVLDALDADADDRAAQVALLGEPGGNGAMSAGLAAEIERRFARAGFPGPERKTGSGSQICSGIR